MTARSLTGEPLQTGERAWALDHLTLDAPDPVRVLRGQPVLVLVGGINPTVVTESGAVGCAAAAAFSREPLPPEGEPAATCDLCGDRLLPGERVSDDGCEVAHAACVAQWFRSNFGREGLS